MNRKISVGMTVTIVILAMTVTFSITMLMAMRLFDHTVTSVKEKESMYNKVAEVDRYVRANDYYDIDETVLYDRLTAGYLLGTGDKYARYYTASAYTDLLNAQSGKLMGIGVELAIDQSGYAKVIKVYDESPAKEAGLQRGDYITTIDGADIKSLGSVEAVQNKLRGESGTSVNVGWLDSENAQHTADLTHSGFTANSVDSALVQGNVGYIKIWQFDNSTPSELDFALRSLTASGAQSFIFDLRDNGGGILDDAISCIELVAPEGVLAYAEDKAGNRTLLGSSTGDSVISQPTVCLVNENTASAAELFASSLRTLCGTRLVGSTTMGKGTIQSSPQRLSDGSAVVVTVAKLICGDGSCFDGTGLTVDVERPLTADEQTSYYDYTLDTDPQIQRAVSCAQQLTGVTTVGGVNDADIAADSAENVDNGAVRIGGTNLLQQRFGRKRTHHDDSRLGNGVEEALLLFGVIAQYAAEIAQGEALHQQDSDPLDEGAADDVEQDGLRLLLPRTQITVAVEGRHHLAPGGGADRSLIVHHPVESPDTDSGFVGDIVKVNSVHDSLPFCICL